MEKQNSLLIVDDDASNLMELASILKPEYKIYAVKDGLPALEKAAEALPDLILLDVVMPDMSGFEVLAELKRAENTRNIPVIFITGVNDSESEREGLSIGAVDYIRKPFDPMVVKHRVRLQVQIVNLQRDLENAAAVAEAANQSKSAFLASMSHEIRTPMNAIMGITDILLQNDGMSHDEVVEGLERIYTSSDMLLSLINDILDFSKIEAGKLDILPSRYKVAGMISDTIHLNLMRIGDKQIKFELQIEEDIPAKLIGDELRIKQILNNLLSNAFKYTDAGKVTLSVSHESNPEKDDITLIISVEDTGYGMTREQLDSLFEEYSRFNEGENRSIEGTGLGLSIMQRLVNLMQGEVDVQSEPGVGTKVTIQLPQGPVDANVLGKKAADDLRTLRQSSIKHRDSNKIEHEPMPYGRVLIVDDTETNLFVAVRFMKPYKLHIDTAVNGREAIEKVENSPAYDVVFMDHMMPEMDGIEATKHLRDSGCTIPIIALTANAMTGQSDMFLQNGFDEFISKPIDIQQLDAALLKFIRDKQPAHVIEEARKQFADKKKTVSKSTEPDSDPLLVESFLLDARKAVTLLDELCNKPGWLENDEDLRKYTITVHGMKSILGHIGETALSKVAMDLETGGREKNIGALKQATPGFLNDLRALVEKHDKEFYKDSDGVDDDIESLIAKMRAVEEKCADYSRKGVLDILSGIGNRSKETSVVLEKIREHILNSEFENAGQAASQYAIELSQMPVTDAAGGEIPAQNKTGVLLLSKKIAGLDIAKGLERYDGDGDVYLKTLRAYTASTISMLDSIMTFDENNLNDYRIKVHGIKGASYDIRANKVGKRAEELEEAATNADLTYINTHNNSFIDSTRKFIGDVEEMLSVISAANPRPRKDKPDEDSLTKLCIACESYNMDEVDEAMLELEKYQYEADDGLVDKLRKCVDLMQFPQIVKMLSEDE